jgi:hypothetical protein
VVGGFEGDVVYAVVKILQFKKQNQKQRTGVSAPHEHFPNEHTTDSSPGHRPRSE